MESLKGLKIAILVEDGFEQAEMVEPRKALNEAGAETKIVSPKDDIVRDNEAACGRISSAVRDLAINRILPGPTEPTVPDSLHWQ